MAREVYYLAIIIKRQPYGEGDEILTLFTKEAGKIRALAKALKMPKSKMRHALQTLFLVNLTVTSVSALPKIIRAEAVNSFHRIRENLQAAKMAFYSLELLLKFTADEHKNERLFNLMEEFLRFLDTNVNPVILDLGLAKFKMEFLESVGLAIHHEMRDKHPKEVGFSLSMGGFVSGGDIRDHKRVDIKDYERFLAINAASFKELTDPDTLSSLPKGDLKPLHDLLSHFIRYHLERNVNSEKFLNE